VTLGDQRAPGYLVECVKDGYVFALDLGDSTAKVKRYVCLLEINLERKAKRR